jgi:tetratricopeptide (TPR) repeat protein
VPDYQNGLVQGLILLAGLDKDAGRAAEAERGYQRARGFLEMHHRSGAGDRSDRQELLNVHLKLGGLHRAAGRPAEALADYERARAVGEALASDAGGGAVPQDSLAVTYYWIGELHHAAGRTAEALAAFGRARDIGEAVAGRPEAPPDARRNLVIAYHRIGELYRGSGHRAKALEAFGRACGLSRALAAEKPGEVLSQQDLAWSLFYRGRLLRELGRPGKALADADQAVTLSPEFSQARAERAAALAVGRWDGAGADADRILASGRLLDDAFDHACLRVLLGDLDGYRRFCARLVERHARVEDPFGCFILTRTCALAPAGLDDTSLPLRWAERAVAAHPNTAWFVHARGLAELRAGRPGQSVRWFEQSLRTDWKPKALDLLSLALASHDAGDGRQTHRLLEEAASWVTRNLPAPSAPPGEAVYSSDWLEILVLQREAARRILDGWFPDDPFTPGP